ncbi:hypothetical protein Tel_07570 [Candidatus Tenderia electrophaga]|jgi:sigma-E factor negative regulatory protein RseB|uniref:Transcriptional regulator n=1 Tax=Candidatus Tenderia electrophaga TaxID=1748243 RepID=A0A0S2TD22_9GAMM|nr:hypothetical protein Tel_07570 [Candidatus Tenderia electrophaga]
MSAILFGIGLVFGAQTVSAGQQSPQQWLEKMSAAMQELSYQGVFVYRRDAELAAMKVTHIVDQHGARELLETLTGEPRREVRSAPLAGDDKAAIPQLGKIDRYYTLELMGEDRTAGLDTKVVSVVPKDEYRYGYRLWLDQTTGLLLKSDLLARDGSILEQVMFTSLEVIEPEALENVSPPHEREHSGHTSNKPQSELPWTVEKLPSGFELLESQPVVNHGDVLHLVYSDGLASVSVFVESAKSEGEAFVGVSRMGAVNAYGAVQNGYQLTVVGEVPEITVKTMGRSLKHKGSAQ